jgi:hypothetical protein
MPLVVGLAALHVRDARGPFWLGANQDPTYVYLLDALRVAVGAPVVHVNHPGTPVQVLGAAVLRTMAPTSAEAVATVVAEPERPLAVMGTVLLVLTFTALLACGWAAWKATGRFLACVIVQAVPFLSGPAVKHMTDLRPEALLLVLAATFLLVVFRGLGRATGVSAAALGVVCGLAVATKVTALPLVLAGLVLLPGGRLRFLGATGLAAVAGVAPVLPQLRHTVRFLAQALSGPGAYGSGLLEGTYGATLRALGPQLAIVLAAVLGTLAIARRPAADARGALMRRALLAFGLAQAASLVLVLLQPQGGSRYLLPTLALFGGNIVLALETIEWRGIAGRPVRVALALASLAGVGVASVVGLGNRLARAAADQRGAAAAASAAEVRGCRVVRYHAASAPEAALLLGLITPSPPPIVDALERRYPLALFLGFRAREGGWSYVPVAGSGPAFIGFRGPLAAPSGCLALQGSPSGPGRVFLGGPFQRETIPVAGVVATGYSSLHEAVYFVRRESPQ